MRRPTESEGLELLGHLYLRLNGFFTTPFIIHDPKKGRVAGEIDCLGFRGRFHSQADRAVKPHLDVDDRFSDLVFFEAKLNKPKLQPYAAKPEAIEKALKWAGVLPDDAAKHLSDRIVVGLAGQPATTTFEDQHFNVRVNFLILSQKEDEHLGLNVIKAEDAFDFIHECLKTAGRPAECARDYGPAQWGFQWENIIEWIKTAKKCNLTLKKFTELYGT